MILSPQHIATDFCYPHKDVRVETFQEINEKVADEPHYEEEFNVTIFYKWILILMLSLAFLVFVLIKFITSSHNAKKKLKKMEADWMENFHAGQENLIDWNDDIVFQAEFLPYRSEFEFPIENIEIYEELGTGEFGVVHKAIAKGLTEDGSSLEVAVKRSKNLKMSEIKAFTDELKIMMFLQKVHKESNVNIINLLGSFTVDIKKGEVCAILELCQRGSLKNFVMKNANFFLDEIGYETETESYNYNDSTSLSLNNNGYR